MGPCTWLTENLIRVTYKVLTYTCSGLVQPEAEDKRIVSASWVKDDGINQCIRLLPNWVSLQNLQNKPSKDSSKEPTAETIEDIRERNSKVRRYLKGNI